MQQVPREFTTSSQVCIITNEWGRTANRNLAAVEDRGHVVHFAPAVEEVHRRTGEWFDDQEIHDWFGAELHRIPVPSMRMYFRAKELKTAGLDWKSLTPLLPDNSRQSLVAELVQDSAFRTQEDRVREFMARGGGCRATFFNHLRHLRR